MLLLVTSSIAHPSGKMIALLTGITSLCAAVAGLAKGVLRKEPGKAEDILTYNATMELDPDDLKKTLGKLLD